MPLVGALIFEVAPELEDATANRPGGFGFQDLGRTGRRSEQGNETREKPNAGG